MTFILGIAGGTGSGKSWLARALAKKLGNQASLIQADWYYRDQSHVKGNAVLKLNFDHPRAIEVPLLAAHLARLRRGEGVAVPQYNYATHARTGQTRRIPPRPILIIEGLFVLHESALRKLLHHSIFIDIPADQRLIHRIQRDQVARDISIEETIRLYKTFARPMHDRFVQPSCRHAREIWNELPNSRMVGKLAARIRRAIANSTKRSKKS